MPLKHEPRDVPVVVVDLPPPGPLEVPWEQQLGSLWCWAASAAMVLGYHQINVSQCELASALLKTQCCGPPRPLPECNQTCRPDQVAELLTANKLSVTREMGVAHAKLVEEIAAGRPVEVLQRIDADIGHMVVVRWAGVDAGVPKVMLNNPLRKDNSLFRFDALNAVDSWTGIEVQDDAAHG